MNNQGVPLGPPPFNPYTAAPPNGLTAQELAMYHVMMANAMANQQLAAQLGAFAAAMPPPPPPPAPRAPKLALPE